MGEIKKKEISIIIPTYEPQEYLEQCLLSLLNQTLSIDKYEILIILNGKKEPYYSKLKKLYKENSSIKIFYTEKKGVSNARNLGISLTDTDYIIFVDDDDFVSKHFLKGLYEKKALDRVVFSNTLVFQNNKKVTLDYLGRHFKNKNKNIKQKNLFYHRKQFSNSCGKLFPKKIIKCQFDNRFSKGEDSLFMAELSFYIKDISYSSKKSIYYRRIRNESASRKSEAKSCAIKRKIQLIVCYIKLLLQFKKNKAFIFSRIIAQIRK